MSTPLAHRLDEGADLKSIVDAVGAVWVEIDVALSPIIGAKGVSSLYARGLHLTSTRHPWLMDRRDGRASSLDHAGFRSLLMQQSREAAVACSSDLFVTIHTLLETLIGPSLARRLLQSVWLPVPGNPLKEDTSE